MALEDTTQDYYHAYKTCSPAAHYLTRQACNYGVVFERYYTGCMGRNGFGGESDATGKNYYEGYMKAYNKCYSSAEQTSQASCNYAVVYQKHYNSCMMQHNFNERGEKINSNSSEPQNQKEGFQFNF
jgi:hypothetical protein